MIRSGFAGRVLLLAALALCVPAVQAQQPATGVIKPLDDLKLSMSVAGRLEAVLVQEGQRVKKGVVLLHLDKALEELELSRRQVLLKDRAKLDEAIKRERTLREQLVQARSLADSRTISRKQLDDEELAYSTALADRDALEAAKKREQLEYELARENLARRTLRAPIDGEVVKIHYQPGESVAVHETVLRLVDTSRVRFIGNLDAKQAARIRVGDALGVRFGSEPDSEVRQGRVVFVSPVADLASGLVEVKVEFRNADGAIRPGIIGQIVGGAQ